jgi:integrase
MPADTVLEKRNRALIAFTLLTGARDSAIAYFKLKHVDLGANSVFQDAREVRTKFSKTFTTYFFPVGDEIFAIVNDWVLYLRNELHWGNDDPLFPKTEVKQGKNRTFEPVGIKQEHWKTTSPIRKIFKDAFEAVDLPNFNPHSFRKTLVELGENVCRTAEEFKAWSQNMGHEGVLTTFYSYGEVPSGRQAEIIKQLGLPRESENQPFDPSEIAKAVALEMKKQEVGWGV